MKRATSLFVRHAEKIFPVLLILLACLYATLSIIRHMHFESGAYDLGIFDQTVWQYSQFMSPFNSIKGRFILGDHLNLTLPLLAPLYWMWSDARMLLGFQSVWLVLSGYGMYLIAKKRGLPAFAGMGVALVYTLFYGFQQAVIFDFHASIIGVGLLVWTAYFLESKKYLFMWIAALLLVLTQENMGIALAGLGSVYVFRKEHRSLAIIWVVLGILATLLATRAVAFFSPVGFEYAPVFPETVGDVLRQMADTPDKRRVWLWSLGWFAFMPLFSPGAMIAVIFDLAQYFLSGESFARNWTTLTHHRAMLAPFLALGSIDVLMRFRRPKVRVYMVAVMVLLTIALQYILHMPLNKLTKPAFWKYEQWMGDTHRLIAMVPPSGAVAAQHNLVPHLTHRRDIYLAWPRAHVRTDPKCVPLMEKNMTECWWLDMPDKVDYLVVDIRPGQWLTQTLESDEHFLGALENMEKRGVITVDASVGTARLYKVDSVIVVND